MAHVEAFSPEVEDRKSIQSGNYYRPNVEITEDNETLFLYAELPGSRAEDIHVEVKDGTLELRAGVQPRHGENQKFLHAEYGVGNFYRAFELSDVIDSSRIEAKYKDGILQLFLPKAETAKPRTVKVVQGE